MVGFRVGALLTQGYGMGRLVTFRGGHISAARGLSRDTLPPRLLARRHVFGPIRVPVCTATKMARFRVVVRASSPSPVVYTELPFLP